MLFIFIMILVFNSFVFFFLFDNFLINSVLIIQSTILVYYIIMFAIFSIKRFIEFCKIDKINPDDKGKFEYYREIIKNYSIGELGYIFNGRKYTKSLILAELEY